MAPVAAPRATPASVKTTEDPQPAWPESAARQLAEGECARLRAALARAVCRICPSRLAAQADDIVQAALLKVLAVHDGRPIASAYLWRAAYTATVDEIRRRRRRREVPLEAAAPPDAAPAAGPRADSDPEGAVWAREIGRGLADCLRYLIEGRRLAVVLHLQGHSVPEAARILSWSDKRVENLVYRGLFDLRRCLTTKGLVP
jgi:RNA polymerase sigma-70 factor (ECF subfamily)